MDGNRSARRKTTRQRSTEDGKSQRTDLCRDSASLKALQSQGNVQPPGFHGRQSIFCCRTRKIMNNVWLLESEGLTLLTSNHAR